MIVDTTSELQWLKSGRPLLVMLPFAGGNAYSYRSMLKYLPDSFDVLCPELPGRGAYSEQSLMTNLVDLSAYVLENWLKPISLDRPYVLFGHSMGAILAHILLGDLERAQLNLPVHLFVSGRGGPSCPDMRGESVAALSSPDFRKKLRAMGGTPDEVLENDELMDYFEPILRADFEAVANYTYRPSPAHDVPITVFFGDEEEITEESALLWGKETISRITLRKMQGDHFFIFRHSLEIMEELSGSLNKHLENELHLLL
jgi:external thioesterase TEII